MRKTHAAVSMPSSKEAMAEAVAVLKQRGAVVVDPADIPSVVSTDPKNSLLKWSACSGLQMRRAKMRTARSCSSTA